MKPTPKAEPNRDLFRRELAQMINPCHELCLMADTIDWEKADEIVQSWFVSHAGALAKPSPLIIGLFLLKQLFDVSDENLPRKWVENPYWRYFCGEIYFQHEFPLHPTSMTKWRNRMREGDADKLLSLTIELGLDTKTIKRSDVKCVNVDSTVQEKAISYPTDANLMDKAIRKIGRLARKFEIPIKQSYAFLSRKTLFKVNNYARTQQHKIKNKALKKMKTYLGRLQRDVERKLEHREEIKRQFAEILEQTKQLLLQTKTSKNKLYSLHAPETECIAKGKINKHYEFGVKVSVVATQKNNFIVGTQVLGGNPYDGHTLEGALNEVEKINKIRPHHVFADNVYKSHSETQSEVHIARKKSTYQTRWLKKLMRGRNAIEAIFSHAKRDGQLKKNYLKGSRGDKLNALLSAVGCNLRLIMRVIRYFCTKIILILNRFIESVLIKVRMTVEKILYPAIKNGFTSVTSRSL